MQINLNPNRVTLQDFEQLYLELKNTMNAIMDADQKPRIDMKPFNELTIPELLLLHEQSIALNNYHS
jgi:hypothetical protein